MGEHELHRVFSIGATNCRAVHLGVPVGRAELQRVIELSTYFSAFRGSGPSYACVVGANHPQIGNRLTLKQFKAAGHILVLPLGASQHGRNVERTLTSRAVNARIVVQISHFHGVLALITSTDLIATIPTRLARTMAQYANIKVLPPPIPFPKGRTSLYWHERFHCEPGNAWLRSEHFRLIK